MSPEIEQDGKALATTGRTKLFQWHPQALIFPEIDPHLLSLHPLVRTAEVLRFSLFRCEHWLSPNGFLREWLRLNLLLAALVAVTGLILSPLVTLLLVEIDKWIQLVLDIVLGLVSIAALVIVGLLLIRVLESFKNQAGRRR